MKGRQWKVEMHGDLSIERFDDCIMIEDNTIYSSDMELWEEELSAD